MSLCVNCDEIIIGLNLNIIFLNTITENVCRSTRIDPNTNPKDDKYPIGPEANENPNPPTSTEPISRLQDLKVSPNSKYLAVTTTGRKLLLLYEIVADTIILLSARRISRASSAVTFSNDSSKILLCDKTGDCYMFDCVDNEAPGKWLFGHLSMVLDVKFTPQQDAILTSDRDEKIRVTNYPATHEIEAFCLGHTEYVSSIILLPTDSEKLVVSVSGDKTVKVWDYRLGRKLHELALPAPGVKAILRQTGDNEFHLAVVVHQEVECVFIYKLQNDTGNFSSSLVSSLSFSDRKVTDLIFCGDRLFLTVASEGRLDLKAFSFKDGQYEKIDAARLSAGINPFFQDEKIVEVEDVSAWFKKKYDNVTEYLERKKRRIDEKISKVSIQCK